MTITLAAAWVFVAPGERAVAAVAPHSLKTALVTVTEVQRVEATAVNDSHACHRTQIWLLDGDGQVVASDASDLCPGRALTLAYNPPGGVRLRSLVTMHSVPPAISEPCRHSFEVQDETTERASLVLSEP